MVMGEARRVLKAEVTRCDAELLVVGTHARSRLSRAVCGSVGGELTADLFRATLALVEISEGCHMDGRPEAPTAFERGPDGLQPSSEFNR